MGGHLHKTIQYYFIFISSLSFITFISFNTLAVSVKISKPNAFSSKTNSVFPLQKGLCDIFLKQTQNPLKSIIENSQLMSQVISRAQEFVRTHKVSILSDSALDYFTIEVIFNADSRTLSFNSPDGFDLKPLESKLFRSQDFRFNLSKLLLPRSENEKISLFIPIENNLLVKNGVWEIDFFPIDKLAEFKLYIDPVELLPESFRAFRKLKPGDRVYEGYGEKEFYSMDPKQPDVMMVKSYIPHHPNPIIEFVNVQDVAMSQGSSGGFTVDDVVIYIDPNDIYLSEREYVVIGVYPYGPKKGMLVLLDYSSYINGMFRPPITVHPSKLQSPDPSSL